MRDPANDYGEYWLNQIVNEEYSSSDRFEAAIEVYEMSRSAP